MPWWLPIGPSAVLKGQASGEPLVSGRVTGIAPLVDGNTLYICTANGGVWKTSDGGWNWTSMMEGVRVQTASGQPFPPSSWRGLSWGIDSQACGAIAVAPGAGTGGQDRIFVGTGEAFGNLDDYFGTGPLVSDDGGTTWRVEEAVPTLAGSGFWRLAIDPADAQHVFAATTNGLYERMASGADFVWKRMTLPPAAAGGTAPPANATSTGLAIARARSGTATHVFAALEQGQGVYHWDGSTWSFEGKGLNPKDPRVTVLAMQRDNPQVVYALVADKNGHAAGVYQLDKSGGPGASWVSLSGFPPELFGKHDQGWYDIALAVDPTDVKRIYLGGSQIPNILGAALFRCSVSLGKPNLLTCEPIGERVHADVHAIEFVPGNPRTLWVGCDGGVFVTTNALGDQKDTGGKMMPTEFASRNLGLSTLQIVRLGMHPTEDGVLFAGVQDNGTLRYTGEELWLHSGSGDGGAVLVNPANTLNVLRGITEDQMEATSNGGQSWWRDWSPRQVPLEVEEKKHKVAFYPPLVGLRLPTDLTQPAAATLLAFGSERVWISTDFGKPWNSIPHNTRADDSIDGSAITALAWASATKLYAGTSIGTVARYDWASATKTWTRRIIHTPPTSEPSGAEIATTVPPWPITSIAVADAAGDSIYVTIGGQLQAPYMRRARVWLGTDPGAPKEYTWQPRSGPGNLADPTPASPEHRLMDVHHSVVIVDPQDFNRLYVGADIGVWRSDDGGQNWYPFSSGIPEAAVVDLKLHPTKRILWAGTHGRGVYEISADANPKDTSPPLARYLVRDTHLDVGRGPSVAGGVDPTVDPTVDPARHIVVFGHSPDIRIDTPAIDGTYSTLYDNINPSQFFQDISDKMKAYRPKSGGPVDNRVFVQVHQRGTTALPMGTSVQVMLLLAPGKTPPALPADYTTNVQNGTAVTGGDWTTVGTTTVKDVGPLMPRIAHFRLSSASLAGHDDWCLLVLLHAAGVTDNEFTSTVTDVQVLCTQSAQSRLAAWSHVSVVETTRAPSTPSSLDIFEQVLELFGLGTTPPQAKQSPAVGVVDG